MLRRKRVVIGKAHMQLWDEAGNFIASYDRTEDHAMCRFITGMIDRQRYAADIEAGAQASGPAPSHAIA